MFISSIQFQQQFPTYTEATQDDIIAYVASVYQQPYPQCTYLLNYETNDQHCKEVSASFNPTTAVNIPNLPENINEKSEKARVYSDHQTSSSSPSLMIAAYSEKKAPVDSVPKSYSISNILSESHLGAHGSNLSKQQPHQMSISVENIIPFAAAQRGIATHNVQDTEGCVASSRHPDNQRLDECDPICIECNNSEFRGLAPSLEQDPVASLQSSPMDESVLPPTKKRVLQKWTQKFDSACSHCMSGDKTRIRPTNNPSKSTIRINGFNNSTSFVTHSGVNEYNKPEHYVEDMPEHLCLLCAYEFARDGAAILMESGGCVIRIQPEQMGEFMAYIKQFPTLLKLSVKNQTYEVDHTSDTAAFSAETVSTTPDLNEEEILEACAVGTMFFNTRLNTSTVEQRILAYLISGLTLDNLKNYIKHNTATGIHPSVTLASLNQFERDYGSSPEAFQLAQPNMIGNRPGFMSVPKPIVKVGDVVEADVMECDINDVEEQPKTSVSAGDSKKSKKGKKNQPPVAESPSLPQGLPPVIDLTTLVEPAPSSNNRKKVAKLPSLGGGLYVFLTIDRYSGYVHGQILKTLQSPEKYVEWIIQIYERDNHPIQSFIADVGVIPTSKTKITTSAVEQLLLRKKISQRISEAYNHMNGTPNVERTIRAIKELMVMALLYILHNPNFPYLGFTRKQIFKLWGELVQWAIVVINMKTHPRDPTQTRYSMYHGVAPNLQDTRLLPIFSVLSIQRHQENAELQTQDNYWQRALYVGPSLDVKGAIRAAVVINDQVHIFVTTQFKNVSNGGNVNPYPHVERVLESMIEPVELVSSHSPVTEHSVPTQELPSVPSHEDDDLFTLTQPLDPIIDNPQASVVNQQEHNRSTSNTLIDSTAPDDINRSQLSRPASISMTRETEMNKHVSSNETLSVSKPLQRTSSRARPQSSRMQESILQQRKKPGRSTSKSPTQSERQQTNKHKRGKKKNEVIPVSRRSNRKGQGRVRSAEGNNAETLSFDPKRHFLSFLLEAEANFADWSNHKSDTNDMYFSLKDFKFYSFDSSMIKNFGKTTQSYYAVPVPGEAPYTEEAYRAVTKDVPKSFPAALQHPEWSEAATTEWTTILDAKTLIKVDPNVAKEAIKQGADMVILFPVYEEKEKEGRIVKKVRLVANGKTHHPEESTYAPTPSREEFLVLMHLIASRNLAWVHIDEKRAFLSASYKGSKKVYTKHVNSNEWFEVLGALYGLKTSPKDYQVEVIQRLVEMGFSKIPTSNCLFVKLVNMNEFVFVYDYVDDFIVIGNTQETIEEHFIAEFRKKAQTTEPIWDPKAVLGMEVRRIPEEKIILLTMTDRIEDLAKFCHIDLTTRRRKMPMPPTGYILAEEDYLKLKEESQRFLTKPEIKNYMGIVGRCVWISGIRFDISFAVLYLSWHTQAPRQHHMDMANYLATYLYYTKDIPLVLGGSPEVRLVSYTDSSLATAPKRRSVSGQLTKLNEQAGAIHAKAKTSQSTRASSFESELDALSEALKTCLYIETLLDTLNVARESPSTIFADNQAMIDFVNGEGSLRNSRHMELRLWLVREHQARGTKKVKYMSGLIIPSNFLTKLATINEHLKFVIDIQGLNLLPGSCHIIIKNAFPQHVTSDDSDEEFGSGTTGTVVNEITEREA